jgi:hypothetical protein
MAATQVEIPHNTTGGLATMKNKVEEKSGSQVSALLCSQVTA